MKKLESYILIKEDLIKYIHHPKFDFDDLISLITPHLEIRIDESFRDPNKKNELVDLIYKTYQKKLKESKLLIDDKEEKNKSKNKDEVEDPFEIKNRFATVKNHIIELCKHSKYKRTEIVSIIDEAWGYIDKDKTAKTLVYGTIRDLIKANIIYITSDDIIKWRV